MNPLGIDVQTIFGMHPLEHVTLAANLGCQHVSLGLTPVPWNPCGFEPWSLRDDHKLRRELRSLMAERNVFVAQAEGFVVRPDQDVRGFDRDLDLMAELGALRASTVSMEPDQARALDQLALLAEITAERGMGLTLEFAPPHPISDLTMAVDAIRAIGRDNVQLVIDAMHFFRSGSSLAELAALPPSLIGYVQLCDAPRLAGDESYLREACFHRMIPGEGELPLADLIAVLPTDVMVGLEVPMLEPAEAGTLNAAIARTVMAARHLLNTPAKIAV